MTIASRPGTFHGDIVEGGRRQIQRTDNTNNLGKLPRRQRQK